MTIPVTQIYCSLDDDIIQSFQGKEAPNEIIVQGQNISGIQSLKGNYSSVRRLDISFNALRSLKGIEQFPRLRQLSAYCYRLDDVGCINEMSYLTSFMIQQNGLTNIPSSFKSLKYLRELRIDRNQLTSIRNLGGCCCLRFLDISFNNIDSLIGLSGLQSLQELRANHNQITTLETLKSLPSIRELGISHNRLVNLDGLQHLPTLEVIHADHNVVDTFKIPQTYTKQRNPSIRLDSKSVCNLNCSVDTGVTREVSISKPFISGNISIGTILNRSRSSSIDYMEETVTVLGMRSLTDVFLSHNQIASADGLDSLGANIEVLDIKNNLLDFTTGKSEQLLESVSTLKRLTELRMGSAYDDVTLSELKVLLFKACPLLKAIDGREQSGEVWSSSPLQESSPQEGSDIDLHYDSSDNEDIAEYHEQHEIRRKVSLTSLRKVSVSGSAAAVKEIALIDDIPTMEGQFKRLLSNCKKTLAVLSIEEPGILPQTHPRKAPASCVVELRRAAAASSCHNKRASSLSRISEISTPRDPSPSRSKRELNAALSTTSCSTIANQKDVVEHDKKAVLVRISSAPNALPPPKKKQESTADLK